MPSLAEGHAVLIGIGSIMQQGIRAVAVHEGHTDQSSRSQLFRDFKGSFTGLPEWGSVDHGGSGAGGKESPKKVLSDLQSVIRVG